MPRRPSQYPTELELEILKIIWRDGPSTARHVRDTLAPTRDLAITTIATMLTKMVAKNQVTRTERSKGKGGILYTAAITRKRTGVKIVTDLRKRVFGGSASELVQTLLDATDLSRSELTELRKMVERREKGN